MRGTESIDLHFDFPDPPATVWRALTEPALLEAWLMPNDIAPIVGHKFNFRTQPIGDWNGIVDCEVMEVVPEKKLSYTWLGGSENDDAYGHKLDTLLTFTLTPNADGGTHLHLIHEGFQADDYAFKMLGQGWRSRTLSRLSEALRGVTS
jgi:uncharacterized protein YndB with AHSA1/START domain